jgi:hypothetical protein
MCLRKQSRAASFGAKKRPEDSAGMGLRKALIDRRAHRRG